MGGAVSIHTTLDAVDDGATPAATLAAALSDPAHPTLATTRQVELGAGIVARRLADAGELAAVQAAASNSAHPYYAQALQATALLRAAARYGVPIKLWAGTSDRAALDALTGEAGDAGPVKKTTRDAIVALAEVGVSWAERNKWPQGKVTEADVLARRAARRGA